MSSIITVQNYRFKVETGDGIEVLTHDCGRCDDTHQRITVRRNGKEITCVGSDITLSNEDEVYGGVVVDENGNVLPDPHWVIHIVPNKLTGMTPDMAHYVGLCGKVLIPGESQDRITFHPETIITEQQDRVCSDCAEQYGKQGS